MSMKIDTVRAKEIHAWIKDHPNEKSKYEKVRVELNGEEEILDVWRIPTKHLIFNIRNGRFASELIAKEKDLKHKLDSSNAADAKIIQKLLLEQKPEETEALKADIIRHGQTQPGIITFDGAVINANRRMAILKLLHEETGDTEREYLRAAILPQNVDQKDLWRIEAGIQFGRDFILDYPPVNELLKLKEGSRQGLSPKDISNTLLGHYSEKQVKEKLEILKLIESYLAFIDKDSEYYRVKGDVEKFNSLYYSVIKSLRNSGADETEIQRLTLVAFSLIRIETKDAPSHWKIRLLRDVAQNKKARAEVMGAYDFKKPEKTSLPILLEAFSGALETVKNEEDQEKPKLLLQRALNAIQAIDTKNPKLGQADIQELLAKLSAEISRLGKKAKA